MFLYSLLYIYFTMEYINFMLRVRAWRSQKLKPIGKILLWLKLTPNILTTLSLLCGLLGIYFLFENYLWFCLFALMHLLFDGIDGVVARLSTCSQFGDYYDHIADSLVTFLALAKIGLYSGDYYAYIVAGMFFLAHGIHYLSQQKAPLLFTRSITLIGLMIYIPGTFMENSYLLVFNLLVLNYLVSGVAAAYSLAKQMEWMIHKTSQH